jgi:Zn finger protein HypA/HybF involved in hydrogenase expression
MKNVTPELIARAKTAQSAEELLALAKTNGIELTEETAKAYFEQLNANTAVSDDELDAVSGGTCGSDEESDSSGESTMMGTCTQCGYTEILAQFDVMHTNQATYRCKKCHAIVNKVDQSTVNKRSL